MSKTTSFHNGTTWSRGHNIHDERYVNNQEHIDLLLTEHNLIIRDVPVRQAYEDIFGEAVKEYNSRKKEPTDELIITTIKLKQTNANILFMSV